MDYKLNFFDPLSAAKFSPPPEPDGSIHCSRVKINQGLIKSVRNLTHDTLELVVKCNEGSESFGGAAGQFATLKHKDMHQPRAYSFARDPAQEAPGEYTFYIRLVPGGRFSGWLSEKNRAGERVTISGALGKFVLDTSNDTMICIAGGSGMSAIMAILEHAAHQQLKRNAYYFYSARTQQDLYCLDRLKQIENKWHKDFTFKFIPTLSREPTNSDWKGVRARATTHLQEAYLDNKQLDIIHSRAYFCGPPGMIDTGIKALIKAGMPKEHIYFDKFEDTSSPAPAIDNTKCVLCDECLFVKPTANCIVEISALHKDDDGNIIGYDRVVPGHTSGLYYNSLFIDENECIRCGACVEACPAKAISVNNIRTPKVLRNNSSNKVNDKTHKLNSSK